MTSVKYDELAALIRKKTIDKKIINTIDFKKIVYIPVKSNKDTFQKYVESADDGDLVIINETIHMAIALSFMRKNAKVTVDGKQTTYDDMAKKMDANISKMNAKPAVTEMVKNFNARPIDLSVINQAANRMIRSVEQGDLLAMMGEGKQNYIHNLFTEGYTLQMSITYYGTTMMIPIDMGELKLAIQDIANTVPNREKDINFFVGKMMKSCLAQVENNPTTPLIKLIDDAAVCTAIFGILDNQMKYLNAQVSEGDTTSIMAKTRSVLRDQIGQMLKLQGLEIKEEQKNLEGIKPKDKEPRSKVPAVNPFAKKAETSEKK